MEFSVGQSVFTCGTQTNYFQRMELLGTTGRLAVEIPFNAPNDRPTQITVADGMAIYGGKVEVKEIPTCDQYTIQGDAFSRAIRENIEVPVPLEDALGNMKVIDAIFRSAKTGRWETP
jgi:predicted dehydrogenase